MRTSHMSRRQAEEREREGNRGKEREGERQRVREIEKVEGSRQRQAVRRAVRRQ